MHGGQVPHEPGLVNGFYINHGFLAGVDMSMRIAREEVFGPILSVLKWPDEDAMLDDANAVDYGLTASIFTTGLRNAHRVAAEVESSYVWVNDAGPHILGAPFGGYKMSGVGREESYSELLAFTQTKYINITL